MSAMQAALEAKDAEIAALQAEIVKWKREAGKFTSGCEQCEPKDAEIAEWKQAARVEAGLRREAHAEIERLKIVKTTALKIADQRGKENDGLRAALAECGAEYKSPPCTLMEGAAYVAIEFKRRMEIAAAAGAILTDDIKISDESHMPEGNHKQRAIQVWVDVDEGIADMVLYLNTIPGVRTHASCQGTLGGGGAHPYRPQVMVTWDRPEAFERLKSEFDMSDAFEGWCYVHPRPGGADGQRAPD